MSGDSGGQLPPPPPTGPQPGSGPPPGQGGYPAPPPPKSGSGCLKIGLIVAAILIGFGVLVAACIGFGANEVAKEIERQTGEADASDYELTGPECSVDEFTGAEATGTIKNTSDEKQGFEVEVRFTAPDGSLVSEDSTFTDPLDVDQTTKWTVSSLETDAPADTSCAVAEVSYHIFDEQD